MRSQPVSGNSGQPRISGNRVLPMGGGPEVEVGVEKEEEEEGRRGASGTRQSAQQPGPQLHAPWGGAAEHRRTGPGTRLSGRGPAEAARCWEVPAGGPGPPAASSPGQLRLAAEPSRFTCCVAVCVCVREREREREGENMETRVGGGG